MYRLAIIDDNDSWCFVLAQRFQQHGFTVSTFTDPKAFIREASRFDLALIDFSMPAHNYMIETNGPDVIYTVKQQFSTPPVLVLISSFFTEDMLDQVTDICPEADAIMSKQSESRTLIRAIEQLLENRQPLEKKIHRNL